MDNALVGHDTRLRHLTVGEREQLRSIARRARGVQDGVRPEYARLYADILHLLQVIGGEFAEGQESAYPWEESQASDTQRYGGGVPGRMWQGRD